MSTVFQLLKIIGLAALVVIAFKDTRFRWLLVTSAAAASLFCVVLAALVHELPLSVYLVLSALAFASLGITIRWLDRRSSAVSC